MLPILPCCSALGDSIHPRPSEEGMILRGGSEQVVGGWIVLPWGISIFFNSLLNLQLCTAKGFLTLLRSAGCLLEIGSHMSVRDEKKRE